jgi:nicotinamidase-related amidase
VTRAVQAKHHRCMATAHHQAMLILDMVSEFRFVDWKPVLAAASRIAPQIARLRTRANRGGVPVIYVNDTRGSWESDQTRFLQRCLAPGARGRGVAQQVAPSPHDWFMFKPRHSAFYATPLGEILEQLQVRELILTGLTSHQCVLFTAMDAYVRNFTVTVPRDCIGAPTAAHTRHALFVLKEALRARTTDSARLRLPRQTSK